MIVTKNISIKQIEPNKGQIEGLPKNPRTIKGAKFDKLVKSIEENPEMLALRELLVYPHDDKYVVIGGNMRLEALKKIGYKDAPCKIIPKETTVEQLKAYTIKDNNGFGEWDSDLLTNEWDTVSLDDWGVDLPMLESEINMDDFFDNIDKATDKDKGEKLTVLLPDEYADQKDEIKTLIETALAEYKGVKIK